MDTEMEFEAFSNLTDIQSFFYGKSIFLTGATGLVGKVILEKILRCCPGVGKIYILMRSKRGLKPEQRLEKIFKLELFKDLKEVFPKFRDRIVIVEGDITEDILGLSFEAREKIRDNVSIVIHSAASVNFNDPLRIAMEHNVVSTYKLMDFCNEMPHLKSVVHLSTSYVKREEDGRVLEKVPEVKIHPTKLMEALEWMDEKSVQAVCDYLLEGKCTTYFVTKAMAEVVIQDKKGDLPVALVRPCYIGPTMKDPFPGWIDVIQGISGLMAAAGKGVLRTLKQVRGMKLNIIPVDIVANTVIASAWHVGIARPAQLFIINCTFDYTMQQNADERVFQQLLVHGEKYQVLQMYRYPDFTLYNSTLLYSVHALIDQWIPAFFIDFFLYIFTGKTILVRVYKKINLLYGYFSEISKEPWICSLDNYRALRSKLSEEDGNIFFMNLDNFDWYKYMNDCFEGGRKFLLHEDPSTINYARKKAKVWWTVTTVLKWFLILYFFYYIFTLVFCSPLCNSEEETFDNLYSKVGNEL